MMRRTVSVYLILLFWLGPLTAIFQSNEESRLPSCCRRHGAHHCAMSMASMALNSSSGSAPIVNAPAHCPYFPGYGSATMTTLHALAMAAASLPDLPTQAHSPSVSCTTARLSQIRTRAGRGPPSSNIG
jgi:hypothetical protein